MERTSPLVTSWKGKSTSSLFHTRFWKIPTQTRSKMGIWESCENVCFLLQTLQFHPWTASSEKSSMSEASSPSNMSSWTKRHTKDQQIFAKLYSVPLSMRLLCSSSSRQYVGTQSLLSFQHEASKLKDPHQSSSSADPQKELPGSPAGESTMMS